MPSVPSGEPSGPGRPRPWVLRDYAVLADGERGAVVGPHGEIVWLCAPRWDSDPVFSSLVGGAGTFTVGPEDPWHVWGGSYEDGSLIHVGRWVTGDTVIECREALAAPASPDRVVLLRRVRAVRGTARVRVLLAGRDGFGSVPMTGARRDGDTWTARAGRHLLRLDGVPGARPDADGALHARLTVPAGGTLDLILTVSPAAVHGRLDADRLWESTERHWAAAVPDCAGLPAERDARHAYAVLHGLTSTAGGMVAAATTSLPERANTGRNYDYRFTWIRDQVYAGLAAAAHGTFPLLDTAVRFAAERVLEDGERLRPAYTVDGGRLTAERSLSLPGYPGGSDRTGNRAAGQFQLDTFGEVLQLFAAAARHDRLDSTALRAARATVEAVERTWQRPDAGLWELENRWWTHSRLAVVTGLRALARHAPPTAARRCADLADTVLAATRRRCLTPSGVWRRSEHDDGAEAGLLLPLARGCLPAGDPTLTRTRQHIAERLADDGYLYRFRHRGTPLGEAEGAFLLCGFMMALAARRDGEPVTAFRWFERTRAACGSPGLFTEEWDVRQRQARGNLPQAFVHALLLESAATLAR
ncbi:glycoside hydrolase family 15 protein [Streptomyces sp. NPDC059853]|uniref:glycoside hydrolase family 15 protein n=1 Tax=Streptomyces sp. NPDC059853 TaxID=3346973 RepID=UPI00364A6A01